MKTILRLYDRLIFGMAALGGASLAAVTVLVIYDVLSRNLGLPPIYAISAVVEYALLFSTMAAAPWLVRINGHVSLSSMVGLLPVGLRSLINKLSLFLATAAVAALAWVSADLTLQNWRSGSVDIRSVDLPGWMLYAFLTVGFGFMATEFLRMLWRDEIYTGAGGDH